MEYVTFWSGKKELRSLSNFWESELVVDGIVYESGEHCFHGEKYRRLGLFCKGERGNKLLEYSKKFRSPSGLSSFEAKKLGGKRGLMLNEDEIILWNNMSVSVQKDICTAKLAIEEVANDIAKSGNKYLLHPTLRCREADCHTKFWSGKLVERNGRKVVIGENMLGKIWMEVRANY